MRVMRRGGRWPVESAVVFTHPLCRLEIDLTGGVPWS